MVVIVASCAQTGAPVGGPEDITPPRVVEAVPPNYSTNFSADKIMITFDEYLDMGNFTQELIVSPPMEEQPVVKMRNKTLIIEFEEELKEDVTYTFNFGEGIKDLNEKNVLLNFEYVFATGPLLDSLSIKGMLRNAYDLAVPEIPLSVMLYNDLHDSLPLTDIPYYVGRADKEGNFAVNNLRKGVYKMFVLKDANNNFLFDLPTEQIAFLDSSIFVDAHYFREWLLDKGLYDSSELFPDTTSIAKELLPGDSLNIPTDSLLVEQDSLHHVSDSLKVVKPDFNSIYVDLFMFEEESESQYISDYSRKERNKLDLIFNRPLSDSSSFFPVFPSSLKPEDLIPEYGKKRDSLSLWLGDTIVASYDTIELGFIYTVLDTLHQHVYRTDTLKFTYREPKANKDKSSGKGKAKKSNSLSISNIRNQGKQHPVNDLVFSTETPIASIDPERFSFFNIPDSVDIPEEVSPYIDKNSLKKVRISKKWKEEGNYRIILYPGAITDIYHRTNDTMNIKFQIRPVGEYGKINLTLSGVEDTILIQIYKKETLVRQRSVYTSGLQVFELVEPDTYRVKLVHDSNNNGKWDTGKYLEGRQPEKVEFYPEDIKIRANWDHDLEYRIGSNNLNPDQRAKPKEEKELPLFE